MTQDQKNPNNAGSSSNLARREFVTLSMAAGLAATASSASAAADVVETNIDIKTRRPVLMRAC
jgi:hypothetical protein